MKRISGFLRFPAVATVALAIAVSTVPLAAQTHGMRRKTANNAAGTQGRENWRAQRFDEFTKLLNLTPPQQQQAKTIWQNAKQQATPLMPQIRANREEIQKLVTSGNTKQFDSRIKNLANKEGSLIARVITIRTKAYEQFYSMLTPDQRAKAKDLYQLMSSRRHLRWEVAPTESGPAPTD